jgi:NADH-quinone oxidoreductase subunit G
MEMSDDQVTIEIDGKPVKASKGEMLIAVADREDAYIPRFCYHKKLSIAANCRMCLVDVENAPKPMPACATPVMDGMKVFTDSPRALSAQKGVMEFLLINHPLDCPVCDQGGECELQDLAMGFGSDVSRYTEKKRVVKDKNIGPLISTDMTRCIHCTRCVRFGQEVAGIKELGATGRGEHMEIGTYIENSVDHELSGNVIDLCPVGALNSKPFRMRGRSWEMIRHRMVSAHDAAGSNTWGHTLRGKFVRVVPRENEDINEIWLSDRDRFSYEGILSDERLLKPMVRENGQWQETSWEIALEKAASLLKTTAERHGAEQLAIAASPSSTLEEFFLAARIAEHLGTNNIDHRLRQADFRNDAVAPAFPALGRSIASLDSLDAALVVGSNLRKDVPIVAHRIRKAAMAGAKVGFVNARRYEWLFPVHAEVVANYAELPQLLAEVLKAVADKAGKPVSKSAKKLVSSVSVSDESGRIAESLVAGDETAIILGDLAEAHPQFADLQVLAQEIARLAGASWGVLSGGANSAGGWLAGALPHRAAGNKASAASGLDARRMFAEPRKSYLLLNTEPELDAWNGAEALAALQSAESVIALTAFVTPRMKEYAEVLLPAATMGESYGTFINAEGAWQAFNGASQVLGEARPGWKVLRVLGNLVDAPDFDYMAPEDVTNAVRDAVGNVVMDMQFENERELAVEKAPQGMTRVAETAMYAADPLVRRAPSLQKTTDAQRQRAAVLSPADAEKIGVHDGEQVTMTADDRSVTLTVSVDEGVVDGSVWVAAGNENALPLGARFGSVTVSKA